MNKEIENLLFGKVELEDEIFQTKYSDLVNKIKDFSREEMAKLTEQQQELYKIIVDILTNRNGQSKNKEIFDCGINFAFLILLQVLA